MDSRPTIKKSTTWGGCGGAQGRTGGRGWGGPVRWARGAPGTTDGDQWLPKTWPLRQPFVAPRGLCYGPSARLAGCGPLGKRETCGEDLRGHQSGVSRELPLSQDGDGEDLHPSWLDQSELIDLTDDTDSEDVNTDEGEQIIKAHSQVLERWAGPPKEGQLVPCQTEHQSERSSTSRTPRSDATDRS